MVKRFFLAVFALLFLAGCAQQGGVANDANALVQELEEKVLTVYTYDSMVSEYGIGPKIIPKFEAQCSCKVNMLAKGDAGQVLAVLALEKSNPKADIAIGIDNSMAALAKSQGVFEKFTPQNINLVHSDLLFDDEGYLVPYDYGFIAFIYDSQKVSALTSMNDMLKPSLAGKVVIQNPHTSSPGLALLLWSVAVYGDPGYKKFWQDFKTNLLTVTDGWDESAGLFSAGETPIYLGYATSPPYYVLYEGKPNYVAAVFSEGHYIQIEGVAIVRGTKNRELAQDFIEFMLSESFQSEVPLNQYMFPANKNTALPDAFKYAARPKIKLELDPVLIEQKREEWILEWEKIMLG